MRITDWFRAQHLAGNPKVRQIGRRMFETTRKPPKGVSLSQSGPDGLAELFSTEVDFQDLDETLRQVSKDYGLKLEASCLSTSVLELLERAPYVKYSDNFKDKNALTIWFGQEDLDTVQIVLTEDRPSSCQNEGTSDLQ